MRWPDQPTCHDREPSFGPSAWRDREEASPLDVEPCERRSAWERLGEEPDPDDDTVAALPPERMRSCSYCGSLHPADLVKLIADGGELEGSDWKYGWPHKFYVRSEALPFGKWYNTHLLDEGYDDEAYEAIFAALKSSDIEFFFDDEGKLKFKAPSAGYQRMPSRVREALMQIRGRRTDT